jgi:hypothetical protein
MKIYLIAMVLTAALTETHSFLSAPKDSHLLRNTTTNNTGPYFDATVNQLVPMNRAISVTIGGTSMQLMLDTEEYETLIVTDYCH